MIILISVPAFAVGQAGLDIAVLKAGVGARALGMGSAFSAVSDNVDAPYWNPAGLSQVKDNQLTTMQTRLSTDVDHYYISYVQPFLSGSLGISWIQVSLGNISQTGVTTSEYNEVVTLGIFSYFSNAYLLAYGQDIAEGLSFGITAKYLTTDMPGLITVEGGAYGYSVTPGILWKPTGWLSIGYKIDEIINYQKWTTKTEEVAPPKHRIGVAWKLSDGILLSGDVSQIAREGYLPEGSMGVEWKTNGIALRGGYENESATAGIGFEQDNIRIDYAYVTQIALSTENVHRIALTGRW